MPDLTFFRALSFVCILGIFACDPAFADALAIIHWRCFPNSSNSFTYEGGTDKPGWGNVKLLPVVIDFYMGLPRGLDVVFSSQYGEFDPVKHGCALSNITNSDTLSLDFVINSVCKNTYETFFFTGKSGLKRFTEDFLVTTNENTSTSIIEGNCFEVQ